MTSDSFDSHRLNRAAREALYPDLRARYKAGETIRQIADAHGRSYGWAHRTLLEAGVVLRPRGYARTVKRSSSGSPEVTR